MKLSIITINYNNKTGLEKTMQSVLQQTATDFEYILIDGASTDGSREDIEQYAANPEHSKKITYWVSEKDTGIYNAMNKGIKQAKGDFCLFLNSGDTLFAHTTIEKTIPFLKSFNTIYYANNVCKKKLQTYPENVDLSFFISGFINHQTAFIPHKLFINFGYYDESYQYHADYLFFLKTAYQNEANYCHINIITTNYDVTGISSNKLFFKKRNFEAIRVFHDVFGRLAPFFLELANYRSSIYGTTLKLYGTNKFYILYLKLYKGLSKIILPIKNILISNKIGAKSDNSD